METKFKVKGFLLSNMSWEMTLIAVLVIKLGGVIEINPKDLENINGFVIETCPDGKIIAKAN